MSPFPPGLLQAVSASLLIVMVGGYRRLEEIQRCQRAQSTVLLIMLQESDTEVSDEIKNSLTPGD